MEEKWIPGWEPHAGAVNCRSCEQNIEKLNLTGGQETNYLGKQSLILKSLFLVCGTEVGGEMKVFDQVWHDQNCLL